MKSVARKKSRDADREPVRPLLVGGEKAALAQQAFDEHHKLLGAVLARRAEEAEMLVKAHIGASRAEIRQIRAHRPALVTRQGREALAASEAA